MLDMAGDAYWLIHQMLTLKLFLVSVEISLLIPHSHLSHLVLKEDFQLVGAFVVFGFW